MRNCFLSCEADETPATHYFEDFGDDNVVFSTDYPHADSKFPHATKAFLELPFEDSHQEEAALGQLRQALQPARHLDR